MQTSHRNSTAPVRSKVLLPSLYPMELRKVLVWGRFMWARECSQYIALAWQAPITINNRCNINCQQASFSKFLMFQVKLVWLVIVPVHRSGLFWIVVFLWVGNSEFTFINHINLANSKRQVDYDIYLKVRQMLYYFNIREIISWLVAICVWLLLLKMVKE